MLVQHSNPSVLTKTERTVSKSAKETGGDANQDILDAYFSSRGIDSEALKAAENWTRARESFAPQSEPVNAPTTERPPTAEIVAPATIPSPERPKKKVDSVGILSRALVLGVTTAASFGGARMLGSNAIQALAAENLASAAGLAAGAAALGGAGVLTVSFGSMIAHSTLPLDSQGRSGEFLAATAGISGLAGFLAAG